MGVPFKIKKAVPFPNKINKHASFTWKNTILIWGGSNENNQQQLYDRSVVYMYELGDWIRKQTIGDAPQGYFSGATQVINDTLFVAYLDKMCVLDLNTWTWSTFFPGGIQLSSQSSGVLSWVYNGKIYLLDDWFNEAADQQLCCYNVANNSWEWINYGGDIPNFEYGRKALLNGDTVILLSNETNGLYTLNMISMRWTKMYEDLPTMVVPGRVKRYTFTKISHSAAVLLGAYKDTSGTFHTDCWLLNLDYAIQFKDPSTIWTKFPSRFVRYSHGAVWNEVSKELWVIGGFDGKNWVTDVLKMSFDLPALKILALDCAARNICTCDSRLGIDQLPVEVRNEFVEYKSDLGVEWLTLQEDKCEKCQLRMNGKLEENEHIL